MIGLIVCRSKNNVIGKDGKIPWNIKGEQDQFRDLTTNNSIIMGRSTYEEIGHPLPNRKNIVVSNSKKYYGDNLITVSSLQEGINKSIGDIFIAGGYNLFKEAIDLVDVMYITEVNFDIENGDVFFPDFDEEKFEIELIEDNNYKRKIYKRK